MMSPERKEKIFVKLFPFSIPVAVIVGGIIGNWFVIRIAFIQEKED